MADKTLSLRKKAVSKTSKTGSDKKSSGKREKMMLSQNLFSEYVQKRAYYIWQESGKPLGNDWEIWLKAERDIRSSFNK